MTFHFEHWGTVPEEMWTWPNFTPKEMACRKTSRLAFNPDFMDRLQHLRASLKFPLVVNSGYRSPEYDKAIGGANVHTSGQAVDIAVYGERAHRLLGVASVMRFKGLGINQHGAHHRRFIHLDDIDDDDHPRPYVWSYK